MGPASGHLEPHLDAEAANGRRHDAGERGVAAKAWPIAGLRADLPGRRLHGVHELPGVFHRRSAPSAHKNVDRELKGIGGGQPLHDERLGGFVYIAGAGSA